MILYPSDTIMESWMVVGNLVVALDMFPKDSMHAMPLRATLSEQMEILPMTDSVIGLYNHLREPLTDMEVCQLLANLISATRNN